MPRTWLVLAVFEWSIDPALTFRFLKFSISILLLLKIKD
jgi:hypothetical protein